jgi:hypothetical protein
MSEKQKPENPCKGCESRDRIIAALANHADELREKLDKIFKTLEQKVPVLRRIK